MNSLFCFHRIKLLSIRYLTEHWRRELVTLSVFLIAFTFIPRIVNTQNEQLSLFLFFLILFFGGARFTAHIFQEIHQPSEGMHFVHIPASRLEKYLFNGVITLIIYPCTCLLLYYGGNLLGNLFVPIMPSFLNYRVIEFSFSSLIPNYTLGKWLFQLLIYYAIFFLGSLFFKKHPTTRTFLAIFIIGCMLSLIEIFLIKIIFGGIDSLSIVGSDSSINIEINLEYLTHLMQNSRLASFIAYLAAFAQLLFFWIVSYLKFKEKQV